MLNARHRRDVLSAAALVCAAWITGTNGRAANTPAPAICPAGTTKMLRAPIETFDAGLGTFTSVAAQGTGVWTAPSSFPGFSGVGALGAGPATISDYSLQQTSAIFVPLGGRMYFDHAYAFDSADLDGGIIEYSVNGGSTWTDASSMIDAGQTYPGRLDSSSNNPLHGHIAFVESSGGATGTRFDITSQSGKNFLFRFRIGTNNGVSSTGWVVDNVQFYTCWSGQTFVAAELTTPISGVPIAATSAGFSWSAGTAASSYWLDVGSTAGSHDIYTARTTSRSVTVTGIPVNAQPLYARLWTEKPDQTWVYVDYTFSRADPAATAVLTSPTVTETIVSTPVTFAWSAVSGATRYWLDIGTTEAGSANILSENEGTNLSATVSGISLNGASLYVRLWTTLGGSDAYVDYTLRRADPGNQALLYSPKETDILNGSTAFEWSSVAGATQYWLDVGSSVGGTQYFTQATTQSNLTVTTSGSSAFTHGQTVYVRLWTQTGGQWKYVDYVFKCVDRNTQAVLISPTPGTTLNSASATFTWDPIANFTDCSSSTFRVDLGTTLGGSNIDASAYKSRGEGTSFASSLIPTDGRTLYVRLWTKSTSTKCGIYERSLDYTYSTLNAPVTAVLTSPDPAATIAGSTTFVWSVIPGATSYQLDVGATSGGTSIYSSVQTGQSATVTSIPLDGNTLWVRVWTQWNGTWYFVDQSFARSTSATHALLTHVDPAMSITSASLPFVFAPVSGATSYTLTVGTAPGGSQYQSKSGLGFSSVQATGMSLNGFPLYVRLSTTAGLTTNVDYVFTRANAATQAILTAPDPAPYLTSTTVPFSWTSIAGATRYWLDLGTTPGATDILSQNMGTSTSATVTGVPIASQPLFARLWTRVGSSEPFLDFRFERTDPALLATLTAPHPNASIVAASTTFSWNAVPNAASYWLDVSTAQGGADIFTQQTSSTSLTVAGIDLTRDLPVWARMWTLAAGEWRYIDYVYQRANTSLHNLLTSPTAGPIASSSVTFSFTNAGGWLDVGTSLGAQDIYSSQFSGSAVTVSGIPLNGRSLYVRVWRQVGGTWYWVDYVFSRSAG